MKKLLTLLTLVSTLSLYSQAVRPGPVIITTTGGSSTGGTGGTGGVLTNNTIAAVIANFYTNSTPHWIEGEARLGTSTAGRIQCAVTNSDNSLFFHYQNEVATITALSNTISFKVPPGGWWKFIGLTTTATDGQQQLLYMATNGSVSFAATAGTVTDGVTQAGLAAGSYPMVSAGAWLHSGSTKTFYSTFTNAMASASAGDTVELERGFHYVTSRLSTKTNLVIIGQGPSSIVVNGYTNSSGASLPIIPLRSGMIVENLSCTNLYQNRPQAFIGSRSDYGDEAFTNALVRNVSGTHGIDWYIIVQTNACSVTMEAVEIFCAWDSLAMTTTAGKYSTNIFFNCNFINTGPNQVSPIDPARGLVLNDGTIVKAYNSSFIGVQTNAYGLAVAASTVSGLFVNCSVLGIGQGALHVYNQIVAPITFVGSTPSFERCLGSAGVVNTAPFDAYIVENSKIAVTNIVAPLNSTLKITSGDEFSFADTTMGLLGEWSFPSAISVSGTSATITSGTGAPSGSKPNGSIYMRTDGGASTTLYIRHSGTWIAK